MTTQAMLDDRYGRTGRGRRRGLWIGLAILAALLVGGFGWMTVTSTMNQVTPDDLGYELVDDHTVEVRFQFVAPVGSDVACAVQALDEEFGIVGWRVVEYPASDAHLQTFTETVPTVSAATTGLVERCWVA